MKRAKQREERTRRLGMKAIIRRTLGDAGFWRRVVDTMVRKITGESARVSGEVSKHYR